MSKSAFKRHFRALISQIRHFLGFKPKIPAITGLSYLVAGNYQNCSRIAAHYLVPGRYRLIGTDPSTLRGLVGHGRDSESPLRLIICKHGWDEKDMRLFIETAYAYGFIEPRIW